jgi:microcystin-dependent protein
MTYTSNPGAQVTEPYTTGNVGGGGSHNTMPPYLAINFIIKT